MMLDWFYRLIHFRQRRTIVLRLKSSFTPLKAVDSRSMSPLATPGQGR
jgi:hypothetical protein